MEWRTYLLDPLAACRKSHLGHRCHRLLNLGYLLGSSISRIVSWMEQRMWAYQFDSWNEGGDDGGVSWAGVALRIRHLRLDLGLGFEFGLELGLLLAVAAGPLLRIQTLDACEQP